MSNPKEWALPAPKHHQKFEALCRDLLNARYRPLVEPQLYGRNGQPQFGVDMTMEVNSTLHAFQFKCVQELAFKDVEKEVAKTVHFPNLVAVHTYSILTTVVPDARLQDEVTTLSLERTSQGLFPVTVIFWPTIQGWLAEHKWLLLEHYKDIVPSIEDLLLGQARRLDREFPGTRVQISADPMGTHVLLQPGPDGIPLSATFTGPAVQERLMSAMKSGNAVSFAGGEFTLRLPDVLHEMIAVPSADATDSVTTKITLTPVLNGRTVPVRVVVQRLSAHPSMEQFEQRAPRSPDARSGTLTIVRHGTEHVELTVRLDQVPLHWVIDHGTAESGSTGKARTDRNYTGATVHAALAAERLIETLDSGSYVGIFGEGISMVWLNDVRPERVVEPDVLRPIEALAKLAELTGWDLVMPETISPSEFAEAESLLDLFSTGSRRVAVRGRVPFVIESDDRLARVQTWLREAVEPMSACLPYARGDAPLLGQTVRYPTTYVSFSRVVVPQDVREAVFASSSAPVTMHFAVDGDAEVRELLKAP